MQMPERDTKEFLAALGVGAVLGVVAAWLLRREPPSRRDRLMRELKPLGKKAKKTAKRARSGAGAALDRGGELVSDGRESLADLRDEVFDIVSSARDEFAAAVREQMRDAEKAIRRMRSS
jgi:gas vesicle protein